MARASAMRWCRCRAGQQPADGGGGGRAVALGAAQRLPFNLDLAVILFVSINVGLSLFNLIPLGPLDGFSVLSGIVDSAPRKCCSRSTPTGCTS